MWRRVLRLERSSLGRRGERAAARFLKRKGYRIIGRNVRLRRGEIDLIALAPDRRTIVIVEVKTRRDATISPQLSVTAAKERTLVALTDELIAMNRWRDRPVRIDIVDVHWGAGAPEIRHIEHAVRSSIGGRRASPGKPSRVQPPPRGSRRG